MSGIVRCDRRRTARLNPLVQFQTARLIAIVEPKIGRPEITGGQTIDGANQSDDFLHLHRQLIPFALVFDIMLQPLLIRDDEPFDGGFLAGA